MTQSKSLDQKAHALCEWRRGEEENPSGTHTGSHSSIVLLAKKSDKKAKKQMALQNEAAKMSKK
jgi:hypothetical protein